MPEKKPPLPAGEHVKGQYRQVRPLVKALSFLGGAVGRQARDLEEQFKSVERMKTEQAEFARRFAPLGWTIYDRMSVDLTHNVVSEGNDAEAERLLVAHHLDSDQLSVLGYRFHVSRFEPWQEIYERAVERVAAADYISAIPLALIIIDGICTTKSGKHPFSGGADAPVFDTDTSGPGGLAEGLAVLGKTRRSLDTAPLTAPYRHGIVHGLNPSFGHAIVAAKAFNLLQAIVDYFDRREDEAARIAAAEKEQRPATRKEIAETRARTREMSRQIDAWAKRPNIVDGDLASSGEANQLDPAIPEGAAAEYLDAIAGRNFGRLAAMTIDYPLRPVNQRAGMHRTTLGEIAVTGWKIVGVTDESPAISVVTVRLEGDRGDARWCGEQKMRLVYSDEKFDALVRGAKGGSWAVMPNFLPDLWGTITRSVNRQRPDMSDDSQSAPPISTEGGTPEAEPR